MSFVTHVQNLADDTVSLAPLKSFLHAVRLWFWIGISGLAIFGLIVAGVVWVTTPRILYGSLGISINFLGSQQGTYPNQLPFSPEDLLAPSILRHVYEKNRIQDVCAFEEFETAFSIRQDGSALEGIAQEYADRLSNKKLSGPERLRLQEELRNRLKTVRSTEYQLIWEQPERGAPPDLQAKVLEDIPRTWSEEALKVKRVLEFPVPLPNPRAPFDLEYAGANPSGAFDQLAERANALGTGLGLIAALPGANQAALPDGVSLVDLQIRHRSFVEQDLEGFQNRILFQQASAAETALIQEALSYQIRSREEELELAQRRVKMLTRSLDDYLKGRRLRPTSAENLPNQAGQSGDNQEKGITEDLGNAEIPLLGRLEEVATVQQEQSYRRDFIEKITLAREDVSQKQARLEESRRNTFLVKKTAPTPPPPVSAAKAGGTADPGGGALQTLTPIPTLDPMEFSPVWNQLNSLIGMSESLVGVISKNYLGDNVTLYTVTRPYEQKMVAGIRPKTLALFLVAWVALGSAILVGVLCTYYRWKKLLKNARISPSP